MIDWVSIWIGAIVSILLTMALTLLYRWLRQPIRRSRFYTDIRARYFHRWTVTLLRVTTSTEDSTLTKLGKSYEFPWITVAFGPFQQRDIEARYTDEKRRYWPEVAKWHGELLARQDQNKKSNIYNSPGLRLVSFAVSRTGGEERPSLDLRFCNTDYYHNLVSDQRLDYDFENEDGTLTTLRRKYCAAHDLRKQPYGGNACHFGVQLAVVTRDELLVVPVRGDTAIAPGAIAPSVAEGALPATDIGPAGEYLPYLTAARGLREELGVGGETHTSWMSFGANPLTGQYGLVGLTRIDMDFQELKELFELAITKDQWENSKLHGVPFSPRGFAEFLEQRPRAEWSPFALIAFTHALISEYGWRRVRQQLGDISVRVARA